MIAKPDINHMGRLTPVQKAALDEQAKAAPTRRATMADFGALRQQALRAKADRVYREQAEQMKASAPLVKGGQGRPDLSAQQAQQTMGVCLWVLIALALVGVAATALTAMGVIDVLIGAKP